MDNKKRQIEIRQGLIQYLGAMMENDSFTVDENRQLVVAALLEEAIALINTSKGIDTYAARPLCRATVLMIDLITEELLNASNNFEDMRDKIDKKIKRCNITRKSFEKFLNEIFGKDVLKAN